jgi:hypothetical protein
MSKVKYKELFEEIQMERFLEAESMSVLYELCQMHKLSRKQKENLFDQCVDPDEYVLDEKTYLEMCRDDKRFKKAFPTLELFNEDSKNTFIEGLEDGPGKGSAEIKE